MATRSSITPIRHLDLIGKESGNVDTNTKNLESNLAVFSKVIENVTHMVTKGSFISESGIRVIAKFCPNLTHIHLPHAFRIDDEALNTIAELFCKTLVSINLHSASNCFNQTIFSRNLNRIDQSKKHDIKYITDTGVTILLTKCTQLKEIDLSYTQVSPKILEMIATQTQINKVFVSHCGHSETHVQEWDPVIEKYRSDKLVIIDDRRIQAKKRKEIQNSD